MNQLISGTCQGLDDGVQMGRHDDEGKELNVSLTAEPGQGLQDDICVNWIGEDRLPTGYGTGDEVKMMFVEDSFVFHSGILQCIYRARTPLSSKKLGCSNGAIAVRARPRHPRNKVFATTATKGRPTPSKSGLAANRGGDAPP